MRFVSFVALLLLTSAAHAFKGVEHERLSNLALWLALGDCDEEIPSSTCAAAQQFLPSAKQEGRFIGESEDPPHLSFGTYTRAGDFFTHVQRVVPRPRCCKEQSKDGCPKALFCDCEQVSDSCYHALSAWIDRRIQNRQRNRSWPLRVLAAHHNTHHFREFAGDLYSELHLRAARLAARGEHELALRTEAFALHFLQDLFAPGHLASARADVADPASGYLHDRFNEKGLPFLVGTREPWCGDLDRLEAAILRGQPSSGQGATITFDSKDVEALRGVIGCDSEVSPRKYQAFGDRHLLDRPRIDEDRRAHRTFLLLASAASIRQILEGTTEAGLFTMCFQRQSGVVAQKERPWSDLLSQRVSRVEDGSATRGNKDALLASEDGCGPPGKRPEHPDSVVLADWDTIWAPSAALTRRGSMPLDPDGRTCYPDLGGALAGYATRRECPEFETPGFKNLERMNPTLSVLELSWSPIHWGDGAGGDASDRVELAWMLWNTVPETEVEQRDPGHPERLTGKVFSPLKRDWPLTWSLAVHREEHPEYDAWATGLLVAAHRKLGGESTWDLYVIVEPGFASYENAARETTRWRGSVRLGFGASMLFFETGAERGFALDATGEGHREWRYFAGTRVRISTSWLGRFCR